VNNINKNFAVNEEIRDREIRVIADDGEQLGVIATKEALRIAEEKELDLVMISPGAKPPVCKIMDYGKYIYEQSKKDKEAKKKQKVINLKEIRVSPKITVRFRGREAEYSHVGRKILDNFYSRLEDLCVIEKAAKLEGRNMIMILAPKKA